MNSVQSVPLTPEQVSVLANPDAAWLPLTKEQQELVKNAGPEEGCLFYGDYLYLLPLSRVEAMNKVAFDSAAFAAAEMLGVSGDEIESIECDTPRMGQAFLRVTVTDTQGRSATATGMIPDPRCQ